MSEAPKRLVKRRPARKQVEVGQVEKKGLEQTGQTYNLWYHKWAGGDKYDAYNAKEKSQTRVDIGKDTGYTRADGGLNKYLCMFFARGCCPYGHECSFLHRLPNPAAILPDSSVDVFGREKHASYRDDMGGVGSFNRINRTLYLGKVKESKDTAEVINRHFEEFGEIEKIRVLTNRGIAFVTFVSEYSAQFAKEAMMNQSLDQDEVLNVRWATDDPNSDSKVKEDAYLTEQGQESLAKNLNHKFIESVRQMDELEGLVESRKFDPNSEDYADDVRVKKRARIEEPQSEESNVPTPEPPVQQSSIISNITFDGLKAIAALKRTQPPKAPAPKAASKPSLGLADYGSDSD